MQLSPNPIPPPSFAQFSSPRQAPVYQPRYRRRLKTEVITTDNEERKVQQQGLSAFCTDNESPLAEQRTTRLEQEKKKYWYYK